MVAEIQRRNSKWKRMKQKYYVVLTDQEWRIVIENLDGLHNKLISACLYTDTVDELLIKVAKAGSRRFFGWMGG